MSNSFRPGAPRLAQARPVQSRPLPPSRPMQTSTYSQPQQTTTYSQPQQTYSQPQPTYSQPQPTYSQPSSGGGGNGAGVPLKQLDVYMMNAYYAGTGYRSQYFMSYWKTATCFGLQLIGVWVLLSDQWNNNGTGCAGGAGGAVSICAFLFATYVSIFCTEQIRSLNRYGMYAWGENQPAFVNPMWVGVGLWVNLLSLIMSWVASMFIIYTSENVLDLFLNAVAVTFMITLDDEIIGDADYERISNGGNQPSGCGIFDCIWRGIGGCLLKIHPCWQRAYGCNGRRVDLCDILLCPGLIIFPIFVGLCSITANDLSDQFVP